MDKTKQLKMETVILVQQNIKERRIKRAINEDINARNKRALAYSNKVLEKRQDEQYAKIVFFSLLLIAAIIIICL